MSFHTPDKESTIYRFPRAKDEIIQYIAKLRAKYPAPAFNWKYGGSINPADLVLSSLGEYSRKKLKRLAEKHSLETTGGRRKIIKRMYLHWRAAKFQTGDPYIGYGKGFKSTRTPDCVCGFRKRADIVHEQKIKEEQKEMIREQKKKAIALWDKAFSRREERKLHPRFPRYKFPMRFPRLR